MKFVMSRLSLSIIVLAAYTAGVADAMGNAGGTTLFVLCLLMAFGVAYRSVQYDAVPARALKVPRKG